MSVNRVLFDEPGPKALVRIRWATAVSILVFILLFAGVLAEFNNHGQLAPEKWLQFTEISVWAFLGDAIKNTLLAAAVSMVLVLPAGALLAAGRLSRTRAIRWISTIYIECLRATPTLLLVYIFVGVLPSFGFNPSLFWKLVIPIVLSASANTAELFRAGILAVPKGQSEAAVALGLNHHQTMWLVVFPQALKIVVPSLVTQLVSVLKDTTLGYAASYPELLKSAQNLTAFTGYLIQTYLVIAALYVALNYALSRFAHWLEAKLNGGKELQKPPPVLVLDD